MLIDCAACVMQNTPACHDCVVSFLLTEHEGPIRLADSEADALDHLAEAGLVPRLRLAPRRDRRASG